MKVIHMAAQPLVLESYKNPAYTYDVNVMGTVNVLECIRKHESVASFINVTTDKVYRNTETGKAFAEDDVLDGIDPYSNSKSRLELVTACYKSSFFTILPEKWLSVPAETEMLLVAGIFRITELFPIVYVLL